jgi:hypothetical protein
MVGLKNKNMQNHTARRLLLDMLSSFTSKFIVFASKSPDALSLVNSFASYSKDKAVSALSPDG